MNSIFTDVLYHKLCSELSSGNDNFRFHFEVDTDGRVHLDVYHKDILVDHNYVDDGLLILMKAKWDIASTAINEGFDIYEIFIGETDNSSFIPDLEQKFIDKAREYKVVCESHFNRKIEMPGI